MGFASAGAADEDCVALGVEEAAGGEFTHQSFIDRRVREDELVDILENRELGSADTIADRAGLPVGAFGPDQGWRSADRSHRAAQDPYRQSHRSWRACRKACVRSWLPESHGVPSGDLPYAVVAA